MGLQNVIDPKAFNNSCSEVIFSTSTKFLVYFFWVCNISGVISGLLADLVKFSDLLGNASTWQPKKNPPYLNASCHLAGVITSGKFNSEFSLENLPGEDRLPIIFQGRTAKLRGHYIHGTHFCWGINLDVEILRG